MQQTPIARELVLVGGGHSHVIVLRMLGMQPIPGLQVTLVSPDTRTPYSGMLPGLIAGHYDEDDIHIDLVPLCRFAGARFVQATVSGLDALMQTVQLEGRPRIRYDVLSLDIGITPSLDEVMGARENVIPVKPINQFLQHWRSFQTRVAAGEISSVGFVGAGAGGVELCLAVQHQLRQAFSPQTHPISFHLFSDGDSLLKGFPKGVQEKFEQTVADRGVNFHRNFRVEQVDRHKLISSTDESCALDAIFWVTSAASQTWLKYCGLKLDDGGFVCVTRTLQTESFSNIFAVGDIAHMSASPRPKAGVFAVRQGPPLYRNLRRFLLQEALEDYKPQDRFLSLVSTGDKYAVASRNERSFSGAWVWRWKDWIDRRFMRRFNDLPTMHLQPQTGLLAEFDDQMQCGGCGSKISAVLLSEVLDELGLKVRDDAAVYEVPSGKTMLHSIDYFKSFIDDPYDFARIAVTHALGDIYAMGGQPVTALALVTVPYGKPSFVKSMLEQLLRGAKHQLDEDNVDLVGGHTTEGAELSIGFSVNGIVDEGAILEKSGLKPDQALILTKAIGTGTLFASDMQHKAKGLWISAALISMRQSNQQALKVLKQHGASACTDVTGFGLAGHLQEMLAASECGVELSLDTLPVLTGSEQTIKTTTSTLHEGNRQSVFAIPRSTHQYYELLFDPQTSGGLLASVPEAEWESCVADLLDAGYESACRIGTIKQEKGFDLK